MFSNDRKYWMFKQSFPSSKENTQTHLSIPWQWTHNQDQNWFNRSDAFIDFSHCSFFSASYFLIYEILFLNCFFFPINIDHQIQLTVHTKFQTKKLWLLITYPFLLNKNYNELVSPQLIIKFFFHTRQFHPIN